MQRAFPDANGNSWTAEEEVTYGSGARLPDEHRPLATDVRVVLRSQTGETKRVSLRPGELAAMKSEELPALLTLE